MTKIKEYFYKIKKMTITQKFQNIYHSITIERNKDTIHEPISDHLGIDGIIDQRPNTSPNYINRINNDRKDFEVIYRSKDREIMILFDITGKVAHVIDKRRPKW